MYPQNPASPLTPSEKELLRSRVPLDDHTRARIRAIDPAFSAELDRLHDEYEAEQAAMRHEFFGQ